MALRFLFVGMMTMALAGCAPPAKMQIHSGPLAESNPGLTIPYRSSGQGNIGSMWFSYPANNACTAKWERLTKRVSADLLRDGGDVTWHGGLVGSEGNQVFHQSGNAQILGAGDCTDGTTFVFFSVANGYKGRGALKDSHGNMFTMMLR